MSEENCQKALIQSAVDAENWFTGGGCGRQVLIFYFSYMMLFAVARAYPETGLTGSRISSLLMV